MGDPSIVQPCERIGFLERCPADQESHEVDLHHNLKGNPPMKPSVLVVGGGPVGLTMAAELARYGVAVRIVDKAAHRSETSKALVVWPRTLELLDRMGCGSTFVSAGHKVIAANIHSGGKRIGHVGFESVASPHPYALMIPQSETERLLGEQLHRLGVDVERRVEVAELRTSEEKVTSSLLHPDGTTETLETDWLIGCDGAHSLVRHQLGMQFVGDTLLSDWILADVHLGGAALSSAELDLFWHSDGMLALFPISPGRYRIVADMAVAKGDGDRSEPTLEEVQAILDERGPARIRASDPVWLSRFRINERKVEDYRSGRVFLAGDAAHIHSPAGGQGMNTGMQDAYNLAWKLSMVCLGTCPSEALLTSYSDERSPIGAQILAQTGRATSLTLLKNPILQSLRNHIAQGILGFSFVQRRMVDSLTEVSIAYPPGPLVRKRSDHHNGPNPGERAPIRSGDSPFGGGDRPRFALCAEVDNASSRLIGLYPELLEPTPRKPYHPEAIALVRPDGYLGVVAERTAWNDLEQYLDRLKSEEACPTRSGVLP